MTEYLDIPRFLRTKYKDEYMDIEKMISDIENADEIEIMEYDFNEIFTAVRELHYSNKQLQKTNKAQAESIGFTEISFSHTKTLLDSCEKALAQRDTRIDDLLAMNDISQRHINELMVQVENIKSVAQQFIDSPDSLAARTVMINALKQPDTSQLNNLKANNAEEVLSLVRNHTYKASMLSDGCDAVVEIDCLIEDYIKQLRSK